MAFISGLILALSAYVYVFWCTIIFFAIIGLILLVAGILVRFDYYRREANPPPVNQLPPPPALTKVPHRVMIWVGASLLVLNVGFSALVFGSMIARSEQREVSDGSYEQSSYSSEYYPD